MTPKVSIIVPNFNHHDFLVERLDSIFNQTFQEYEVIIFDDASTDNSLMILNTYRNHPKVSHFILNAKNSGSPFKQWKKGLELAKGEYVWIAETDDFAQTNFIEEQLKVIQTAEVAVAKTIIVENTTISKTKVIHPVFKNSNKTILKGSMFFSSPIKNVSCVLFVKPTLTELNKMTFDTFPTMGDQMFYFEFFKNKTICYNEETVSYFRRVKTSVSNFNKSKGLKFYVSYFDQHLRYSKLLSQEDGANAELIKKYNRKHFNKIKNITSKSEKISWSYLSILIKYYLS